MVKMPSFRNSIKSDYLIKLSGLDFDAILSGSTMEFFSERIKDVSVDDIVEFLEYSKSGECYTGRTIICKVLEADRDYSVNLVRGCWFKFDIQVMLF